MFGILVFVARAFYAPKSQQSKRFVGRTVASVFLKELMIIVYFLMIFSHEAVRVGRPQKVYRPMLLNVRGIFLIKYILLGI